MKITITFDDRDDTSAGNRSRIEGSIMTLTELETAEWHRIKGQYYPRKLTYRTDRSASEVIEEWESEGYDISEFVEFKFSR